MPRVPDARQLAEFQQAEQLCRTLAYEYSTRPNRFTIKSLAGPLRGQTLEVRKFSVDSTLAPMAKERARGMIVMPSTHTSLRANENVPIWFTWTGTDSPQSALADIAEVNAGEHSYRILEKQFIEQSLEAIREAKRKFPGRKIELHFTGHSLGGALAQLHFASMERAIAQSLALESLEPNTREHFNDLDKNYLRALKKQGSTEGVNTSELATLVQEEGIDEGLRARDICELSLHPWNATGVTEAVAAYTRSLMTRNQSARIHSKANHVIFSGDPVQQTGTTNIFTDPSLQDITILEVTTEDDILTPSMPGFMGLLVDLGMSAYGATRKHTGRLSHPDGRIKDDQSYRILTSNSDPDEIRAHLEENKSQLLEIAKSVQPIVFGTIHTVSVNQLIEKIENASISPTHLEEAYEALEVFVKNQADREKPMLLSESVQTNLLEAMLYNPLFFEKMDRFFLQAGSQKDMDTVFSKNILKEFSENHPIKGKKLFDRILSKKSMLGIAALRDTMADIRHHQYHQFKLNSVHDELLAKNKPKTVKIHLPRKKTPPKKSR